MSRNIYVAGVRNFKGNSHSTPCFGYSNWQKPTGFVKDIEDCDYVLGLGGSDVCSKYYNQPDSGRLCCSPQTDKLEYEDFKKAIKLKKPIVGICKSSQWGSCMAGGAIFQDISHPSYHELTTFDGKKIFCNSGHHNMQDLSKLKENEDYKLLAWTNNLSPYHINGYNENVKCEKEAEVVFYPKIKWLSFQNHNESIFDHPEFNDMIKWSQDILNKFMSDSL